MPEYVGGKRGLAALMVPGHALMWPVSVSLLSTGLQSTEDQLSTLKVFNTFDSLGSGC